MRSIFLLAALAAGLLGCASHPKRIKPSAHVYSGDAPSIHYTPTESAGGELHTY